MTQGEAASCRASRIRISIRGKNRRGFVDARRGVRLRKPRAETMRWTVRRRRSILKAGTSGLAMKRKRIVAGVIVLLGAFWAGAGEASDTFFSCRGPFADLDLDIEPHSASTVFLDLESATPIPAFRKTYDHTELTFDEFVEKRIAEKVHCLDYKAMAEKAEYLLTAHFGVIHPSQDKAETLSNLRAIGMRCSKSYAVHKSPLDHVQCSYPTPVEPPLVRSYCDFGYMPLNWRITLGFDDTGLRQTFFRLGATERCDVYEEGS